MTELPNPAQAASLMENVAYFTEHEQLLQEVLDGMVISAKPEPGDYPALTFSALFSALAGDRSRAATVAALAVMRLADALPPNAESAS